MIYKVLHTSDWHVGRTNHSKIFQDGSCTKFTDTLEAIEKIKQIIKEREIDIVIDSGDLFQISKPNPFYISSMIDQINEIKKMVSLYITISGNHTASPSTNYNAISPLKSSFKDVENSYFFYDTEIETVQYNDLNFVCMPHTNILRKKTTEEIESILEKTPTAISQTKMNFLITHIPIDGCEFSYDETQLVAPTIGMKKAIKIFKQFHLVCLGDIHKHQKIGENAFYAGSIIQNTFNEEGETKGVYIYEVDSVDKTFDYEFVPIEGRKYTTIKLKDIKDVEKYNSKDYSGDILQIKLDITDDEKILKYDQILQDHFIDSLFVIPSFSLINAEGKVVANLSTSNLIESLTTYIAEVYNEDKDKELLTNEAKDILEKKLLEQQRDFL